MLSNVPEQFNLLFLSTPVGPLGSGLGGGVELTLQNIATALTNQGHQVTIVAPDGSSVSSQAHHSNLSVIGIPGTLQQTAQHQGRAEPSQIPNNAVLENMWDYARQVQHDYHLLVNFAYDWLPFYLTTWLDRPVAHLISMGSLTDAMDTIIQKTNDRFPGTLAVHTHTQAATFANSDRWQCLGNGLDLSLYTFQPHSGESLAWVGRIAPEKGLEDAIAAIHKLNIPLHIFGKIEDIAYWQRIQNAYPDAPIHYRGFLPTEDLQAALGKCRGLVMTPKWIEAFGNVAIEALACGVPVIAYRRGGPAEIVQHGTTGWLVESDNVDGLAEAIAQLDGLDRHACRQQAEDQYSLAAMGDRVINWLTDVWISHHELRL
ncbi:MAG: glycosyltransferase family 4 protein [Cyanobacteria bacterium P01_A01_bin.37]